MLFCHQQAFARQSQLLANLRARVNGFMAIEVPATQVSVSDAVSTYLFNSQLLSRDDGSMMLVLPQECREHAGVWGYLNELLAADNPISELKVFDLRESMANGGGPACLRLRVVLTEEERRAVNPAVMMNDTLFNALNDWVDRYYRDRLTAADLADPQLLREGREALDVLSQLLNLGSVYPFQREGGAMDNFLALTLTGKTGYHRARNQRRSLALAGRWCAGTDAINATARRSGDFCGDPR